MTAVAGDPTPFGALLRRSRLDAGLTQEALAERAALSARAVSDLERGLIRAPRPDTLRLLAGALGLAAGERAALARAARPVAAGGDGRPSAGRRHNLPAPLTSFVGRERELAAVRERLLRADVRLLALTGPGGVGKTRLAQQAAAALVGAFPDGVCFVPLAPLGDPGLVLPAIGHALGLPESQGRPMRDALKEYLADRTLLLVLDNCEHLLGACAAVAAALLRACPRVRILATSREPLGVAGEALFRVAPLALPDPPDLTEARPARCLTQLAALAGSEAVRLFVERARAVQPDFALDERNAATVAQVCRRLDGLPLALELAAARVLLLPPAALLARLEPSLPLLTGGPRDAPPRHQTLRDAIAWSHALLSPEEQTLFLRLAVFSGGCTLDAAAAVGGAPGDGGVPLLDRLQSLVAKSLLRQEGDAFGEPRLGMLETIREYALEQLAESGDERAARRRHLDWCAALAEAAEPLLEGPEQVRWLARLEQELDNLRAAHRWALCVGEIDLALRMSTVLHAFWLQRHVTEGRLWLSECFAREPAAPPTVLRSKALRLAGVLASLQSEQAGGRALLEDALAMARRLGDSPARLAALQGLGGIARSQGDYATASACYEESLALARSMGDGRTVGRVLFLLGETAGVQRDLDTWRAMVTESVALLRASGDLWGTGYAVRSLAFAAHCRQEYGTARALYAEALDLGREVGDQALVAWSHFGLGLTELSQADDVGARAHFAAAVDRFRERGERGALAHALGGFVGLAAARQDAVRAVQLAGAAAALRAAAGVVLGPLDGADLEGWLAPARRALGVDAFAAAWVEGQAMTLEQAVAVALEDATESV